MLSGKYRADGPAEAGRIAAAPAFYGGLLTERNLGIAREVQHVAEALGQPAAAVALNWVRQQPGAPIPILGARTAQQLTQNLGCLDFTLAETHLQQLDAVSQIERGFPHDFLASEAVQFMVYGNTRSSIDFPG